MALKSLGFVGAGQMAKAIGFSLIKKDLIRPSEIIVSCPDESLLHPWKKLGCATTFNNGDVVKSSGTVIWATKPQFFPQAVEDSRSGTGTGTGTGKDVNATYPSLNTFHISIMAGVPLSAFSSTILAKLKTDSNQKLVTARVMPNIGMRVGAGCAVYSLAENAGVENEMNLVEIFASVGQCYKVQESQINAYCGLFASGIGFMFPILEAMSDGGVKMGIPRDLSLKIAAQTMKGAAELVLDDDSVHPGTLKDSVCSPGGTTIAGMVELERLGVRNALISAIVAATERGDQLGKMSQEQEDQLQSSSSSSSSSRAPISQQQQQQEQQQQQPMTDKI